DPILELAASVRDLAQRVEGQTRQLTAATRSFQAALASHRRATWAAIAAVVVAVSVAFAVGHIQIRQVRSDQRAADAQARSDDARRRAEERASCLRGNEVREAVVRGVEVAVARAAAALSADDPESQDQAAALA